MNLSRLKAHKERIKAHFDITIKQADGIPVSSGSVYVTWKRGKKSGNSGETKHVVIKDKKALFEEVIALSCTMYKIPKKGYESKNLSVTLKEEKGKKGNSLAKAVIDLAEFVGAKDDKRTFSLKGKKSKTPVTLLVSIRTKETELSPDDDVTETDKSESSLSDDDDVEDFQEDEPKHATPGKDPKRDAPSTPVQVVSTPAVSTPLSPSSSTLQAVSTPLSPALPASQEIEELRGELEKVKKREADLKKRTKELATENVDQEDRINELSKQVEDLKKGNVQSPTINAEKEAELKKRVKELASENVDLEEQINELKAQVEQLKKQQASAADVKSPNGVRNSAKEEELNKKVQELQDLSRGKDTVIFGLKQDIDKLKQSANESDKANSDKNDLRSRLKELATENLDMEDKINDLKREIESLKKSPSVTNRVVALDVSADLKIKIQDLTELNHKKDEQIEEQREELERLTKRQQSKDKDKNEYQQQIQELTKDNKEKAVALASNKQEIEKLKRDLQEVQKKEKSGAVDRDAELRKRLEDAMIERDNLARGRDDKEAELEQLRDKVDRLKSEKQGALTELDDSRAKEGELRARVQELEETNERLEASVTRSAASLTKDRDRDKEREKEREKREKERTDREKLEKDRRQEREELEKETEKERVLRKKAEKEARELRDQLRELESNSRTPPATEPKDTSGVVSNGTGEEDAVIMAALYETPASYRNEDGVALCAAELWEALCDRDAVTKNVTFAAKAAAALEKSVMRMPNDMNALFYWLSATTALLHMLRDQPGIDSENDRDPIIDGIYKVEEKKPNKIAPLQDQLEWVAYFTYGSLVKVICKKLEPVLVSTVIDQSIDAKKGTQPKSISRILDRVLCRTRDHFLYDAVVQQLFCQIFYFINAHLVNAALKKDRLTASHGVQIKYGISKLDEWLANACSESGERSLLSPASDRLDALREIANALVVDKSLFADGAATQSIFRSLSLRQLKRILEVFVPDSMSPTPLSGAVRDSVASTWNNPRADALPYLVDENTIVLFQPHL